MPCWRRNTDADDNHASSNDMFFGLTKVKIAFFEVDPVTKTGKEYSIIFIHNHKIITTHTEP